MVEDYVHFCIKLYRKNAKLFQTIKHLTKYIYREARVTAVEIDPIMLEVAEQYFDLKQDKRLHVVIDDGLAFLKKCYDESK